MSNILQGDSYDKAGKIWMTVSAGLGLANLVLRDESVVVSNFRLSYSVGLMVTFVALVYLRVRTHRFDSEGMITSAIEIHTSCASLLCSAMMIFLTILHQKRACTVLEEMIRVRAKYSLSTSRSVISYFPLSCIFPCLSIFVENTCIAFGSATSVSPLILTDYCFAVYNYVFYGKMQYAFAMIEDGFHWMNKALKKLESVASVKESRDEAVKELRRLRLMHHEHYNCALYMNQIYSSSIILTIAHNFTNCVLYTFNGIVEIAKPTKFTFGLPHWVTLFYWAICCFFGMYVLVRPCERIRTKAQFTAVALQSLSTRPGYGSAFYHELRLFSSQLILEKVEFKPHDCLMLNSPMVLSTVGAICSSLAILLQMNMGSE